MKAAAALLLGSAAAVNAIQQCTGTAVNEGGNYFCSAVDLIRYENFNKAGSYLGVSAMGSDGSCKFDTVPYTGAIAPLSEGVSIHVRGPVKLKSFAAYSRGSTAKREEHVSHNHARHHGHDALHKRAGFGGKIASLIQEETKPKDAVSKLDVASSGDSYTTSKVPTSGWSRVGYYNAASKVCDGIAFLGNYGGEGSGKFDTTWGNSLAYLNAAGTGGSATSQCLNDVLIPSNKEFSIFTNTKCDGTCGFSRADDVAFKGFSGSNQIFLFEFSMPMDGDKGFNGDMPAIWSLNSRIPRTGQYNSCSCWKSGCGEFDIFEVLSSGDTKAKTTYHGNTPGGSSDYFKRPTDGFIKIAAVFDGDSASVSVKLLPSTISFDATIALDTVTGWIKLDTSALGSLFQLSV